METERLYLRERTREFVSGLFNKSVEEQMIDLGYSDIEEMNIELEKLRKRIDTWGQDGRFWDLIEKNSNIVIGSCLYHNWKPEHERAELGYKLHEEYRSKGYMTETLKAVIDHGFNSMNLNRIEAYIGPDNYPSRKLAEKFGFTLEGTLREHYKSRGEISDSVCYGLLRREWINTIIK